MNKLWLVLVGFCFGGAVGWAQDWSVVNKYWPTGFSANLGRLVEPSLVSNASTDAAEASGMRFRKDVYVSYPAKGEDPTRVRDVWRQQQQMGAEYLITANKDHFDVRPLHCKFGMRMPPKWSVCQADSFPESLSIHRDTAMNWIELDRALDPMWETVFNYYPSVVRLLRWKKRSVYGGPENNTWTYNFVKQQTQHAWGVVIPKEESERSEFRPAERNDTELVGYNNVKYFVDSLGHDTLVQSWVQLPPKRNCYSELSVRTRNTCDPKYQGPVLRRHFRWKYDAAGLPEFLERTEDEILRGNHESSDPRDLLATSNLVFLYDTLGRNVARLHLLPYDKGVIALTVIRYDHRGRRVSETTYQVESDQTVGVWRNSLHWDYDAKGRAIHKRTMANSEAIEDNQQERGLGGGFWDQRWW